MTLISILFVATAMFLCGFISNLDSAGAKLLWIVIQGIFVGAFIAVIGILSGLNLLGVSFLYLAYCGGVWVAVRLPETSKVKKYFRLEGPRS